jgi:hypothetical protein
VYDREEEEDWRIKRLEQDVKIIAPFGLEENVKRYIDCDFFIARMHTVGAIYENFDDIPTNVKSSLITVRILNKDVKDKVRSVLQNLKEYYKNEYTAATVSTMSNMFLKEYLIKHLYPTREERLEQDVLIHTHHIQRDGKVEGDFFIRLGYTPELLKDCPDKTVTIVIKVLNETIRTKLETVLNTIKIETINNINLLKEQLIKHLYPTREERLEQDVQLVNVKKASKKNNDFICDFYIGSWGAGVVGKIYNDIRYEDQYGVKIHNEEKRKEIEDFFYSYREKYVLTGEQYEQSVGGAWLVMPFLKKHLMDILYHQDDPQFEDYDYPEVRKPVHVERAVHGKPLIPIEYREEIVKTPKEETKVAAVALF